MVARPSLEGGEVDVLDAGGGTEDDRRVGALDGGDDTEESVAAVAGGVAVEGGLEAVAGDLAAGGGGLGPGGGGRGEGEAAGEPTLRGAVVDLGELGAGGVYLVGAEGPGHVVLRP